jgi:hypothetical protein
VQHLQGHDVAPDGNKVQSTGEYVVTRENLESDETRQRFLPELQEKRKIETTAYPKGK